jgi:hypothetical protein
VYSGNRNLNLWLQLMGDFLRSLVETHQLNTSAYGRLKLLNEAIGVFKTKTPVNN